ncbi:MAG: hypothetical protein DWQ01_12130 [Planctomycetota bacterium]|nr:MAG: hypothetical protein DWQ01_12130 [Planctomycetota bacterium]
MKWRISVLLIVLASLAWFSFWSLSTPSLDPSHAPTSNEEDEAEEFFGDVTESVSQNGGNRREIAGLQENEEVPIGVSRKLVWTLVDRATGIPLHNSAGLFVPADWESHRLVQANASGEIKFPMEAEMFSFMALFSPGYNPLMLYTFPELDIPIGLVPMDKVASLNIEAFDQQGLPAKGVKLKVSGGTRGMNGTEIPGQENIQQILTSLAPVALRSLGENFHLIQLNPPKSELITGEQGSVSWQTVSPKKPYTISSRLDTLVQLLPIEGSHGAIKKGREQPVRAGRRPGQVLLPLKLSPGEYHQIQLQTRESGAICGALPSFPETTPQADEVSLFNVVHQSVTTRVVSYHGENLISVGEERDFCFSNVLPGRKSVQSIWWPSSGQAEIYFRDMDLHEGQVMDLGTLRPIFPYSIRIRIRFVDASNGQPIEFPEDIQSVFTEESTLKLKRSFTFEDPTVVWFELKGIPVNESWRISGLNPGVWSITPQFSSLMISKSGQSYFCADSVDPIEFRVPENGKLHLDIPLHESKAPMHLSFDWPPHFPPFDQLRLFVAERKSGKAQQFSRHSVRTSGSRRAWKLFIPDGQYSIFALATRRSPDEHWGYWAYTLIDLPVDNEVQLEFERGATKRFQVLDDKGIPVGREMLQILPKSLVLATYGRVEIPFQGRTDSEGILELAGFPKDYAWEVVGKENQFQVSELSDGK